MYVCIKTHNITTVKYLMTACNYSEDLKCPVNQLSSDCWLECHDEYSSA